MAPTRPIIRFAEPGVKEFINSSICSDEIVATLNLPNFGLICVLIRLISLLIVDILFPFIFPDCMSLS